MTHLGRRVGRRAWAICLSQQLVEQANRSSMCRQRLASRVRVLGTGRSNKNDPNDALSVAIAALRSPGLRSVEPADHGRSCASWPSGTTRSAAPQHRGARLHAALVNLSPGGISKELNASDAVRLLNDLEPITPSGADPL